MLKNTVPIFWAQIKTHKWCVGQMFFFFFWIPIKVQKKLDQLRCEFLWEGNGHTHKFHLIKWPRAILLPKDWGGLGMSTDLALHGKSMLMKWHFKYNMENLGLWKAVVKEKYRELTISTQSRAVYPMAEVLGNIFQNCGMSTNLTQNSR